MKFSAVFMIVLSLFISSCNGLQNQEQNNEISPVESPQEESPELVSWEENMELDEGKPWQMNPSTTEGMNRISERLEESDPQTVEEYRELGNQLERDRENIETSRSGENPSDDNLNIYLEPLDAKIQQLQEVESLEEGGRLKSELEQHLYAYSNYFV